MGEAKNRKALELTLHANITDSFHNLGIDTSLFGFYDQQAFLEQETLDPTFLEQYALWVQSRPRSEEYNIRVRSIVPKLTALLADLFEQADMVRSCVPATCMMHRILDRLGVWSFGLKGSLVTEVPCADIWRGQAILDSLGNENSGHSWIVAPPYIIVDPTIRLQNPAGDAINSFIPASIAAETTSIVKLKAEDNISADLLIFHLKEEGRLDSSLHYRLLPDLRRFNKNFPGRQIEINNLVVRYLPTGVRMSDVRLEEVNVLGAGLNGSEVWNDHVAPAFQEFIV